MNKLINRVDWEAFRDHVYYDFLYLDFEDKIKACNACENKYAEDSKITVYKSLAELKADHPGAVPYDEYEEELKEGIAIYHHDINKYTFNTEEFFDYYFSDYNDIICDNLDGFGLVDIQETLDFYIAEATTDDED